MLRQIWQHWLKMLRQIWQCWFSQRNIARYTAHPECRGFKAGVLVMKKQGIKQEIIKKDGAFFLPDEELVGAWAEVYREDWKEPVKITISLQEYPHASASVIRKIALTEALKEAFVPQKDSQQKTFQKDQEEKTEEIKTPSILKTHKIS